MNNPEALKQPNQIQDPNARALVEALEQQAQEGLPPNPNGFADMRQIEPNQSPEQVGVDYLAEVERVALDDACELPERGVQTKLEEVQELPRVEEARELIRSIFGDQTVQKGIAQAVEHSAVSTQNIDEVAQSIATAKESPTTEDKALLKTDSSLVDDVKKIEDARNQLKDSMGEGADGYLEGLSAEVQAELSSFGVHANEREVRAALLEAGEGNLTRVENAGKAKEAIIGEAIVSSLVDNNPGLKGVDRQNIIEKATNDSEAGKTLGKAVIEFRKGRRNSRSFANVARQFSRAA